MVLDAGRQNLQLNLKNVEVLKVFGTAKKVSNGVYHYQMLNVKTNLG